MTQRRQGIAVITLSLGLMVLILLTNCSGSGGDGGDNGNDPPVEQGNTDPVIAFKASAPGFIGGIWVMDADGGNKTHVFGEVEGIQVSGPSWSPDGRFLAFSSEGSPFGCLPDHGAFGLVEFNPDTKEWSEPILLLCKAHAYTNWHAFSPRQDGNRYTLAYATHGDVLWILDIYILTFEVTDNGLLVNEPVNITQTPDVEEAEPSWSPLGDEVVTIAAGLDPDDLSSTGFEDLAIYKADGSDSGTGGESFIQNIPEFLDLYDYGSDHDWARTNADLLLFTAVPEDPVPSGESQEWGDVYCLERSTGRLVNVTQVIDDREKVEDRNTDPSWLPDDSGFVFQRSDIPRASTFSQLVEMRFGDGYDPADGCPRKSHLSQASVVVLAQDEGGREHVGSPDYWRNAPRPPSQ